MKRILSIIIFTFIYINTIPAQNITFSKDFESGSIDSVSFIEFDTLTRVYKYNIFSKHDPDNPADPKLAPSARWYYFKMSGINGKHIELNIKNSDARRPFYSYDGENFIRFPKESCLDNKTIIHKYENDSVYISYFIPYTYTRLLSKIEEWKKNNYVKITSIGTSEEGRDMPMLIITKDTSKLNDSNKKRVYIHGRTHTSESPASWHLEKMIDILTDSSEYSTSLRENSIFYILPFTNPDGVVNGLSRSNINGINLEVDYNMSDSLTAKEVKNILRFIKETTKEGNPFDVFLNMHSQSSNFITYWIHTAKSSSKKFFKDLMLLANLTIDNNPYFSKENIRYSNMASKYLEGWFWDNFKESTLAATFETPYTFYDENPKGEWVTIENIQSIAKNNIYAIGDYLQIPNSVRISIPEPNKAKKSKRISNNKTIYFGNSYLKTKRKNATIVYKTESLSNGLYEIYKWDITNAQWSKIDEYYQNNDGEFIYKYKVPEKKELIDNILLIKKYND